MKFYIFLLLSISAAVASSDDDFDVDLDNTVQIVNHQRTAPDNGNGIDINTLRKDLNAHLAKSVDMTIDMADVEERLHAVELLIAHHPSLQPSTSRWYVKSDDLMAAWWLLLGTMAIIVTTQTIGFVLVARCLHRLEVRTM